MFSGLLQPMHLLLILGVVLIVFGPGKLANVGHDLGKSIREFKAAMGEHNVTPDEAQAAPAQAVAAAPAQTVTPASVQVDASPAQTPAPASVQAQAAPAKSEA